MGKEKIIKINVALLKLMRIFEVTNQTNMKTTFTLIEFTMAALALVIAVAVIIAVVEIANGNFHVTIAL